MQPKIVYAPTQSPDRRLAQQASCIGRLAGMNASGMILVRFPGAKVPMAARCVSRLSEAALAEGIRIGAEVLLVFDGGDADKPVITDLVTPLRKKTLRVVDPEASISAQSVSARVDGRHVTVEAQDRIVLQCGKGSITLNRDGRIVVRGTQIISRSSGANKIKGASVSIN